MQNDSGLIPVEFYCVVELDPLEQKTAGGIILLDNTKDKDKLSAVEGTLVATSPHAFSYADWPEGARKPQPGDRILFKRYDGWLHDRKVNGVDRAFRLLSDKSIVAIVDAPLEPLAVAA
jgi:co-chaperonin GroES (HSP10)